MKNKGTIKFFAIALAVVSIFHLSFTLKTYLIEKNATNLANGNKEVELQYLDSIANKEVYNIGVKKFTYSQCKEREINLGLDLQGGMHITLEVALDNLLMELSGNNKDKTFVKALTLAKEKQSNGQKDFITYFEESFNEIAPDGKLASIFATLENKDEIDINSPNEDVISFIRNKSKSALESTFEVLRKRIDKFGVTQPNIQLLEGTGRIIVELPGVDDPERIRKLLKGTARLEFWETFESKEIIPMFEGVNKILAEKQALSSKPKTDTSEVDTEEETFFSEDENVEKEDSAKVDKESSLMAQVDDTSTVDSEEAPEGQLSQEKFGEKYPLYKILYPSVTEKDGKQYFAQPTGPVVGRALAYDTTKINNYLSMKDVRNILPPDIKFAWSAQAVDKDETVYELLALKITTLNKEAPLDGKVITNARVDISPMGEREISLSMNSEGAKVWRRLTGDNIGKSIAIALDGLVYSYPTVQSEISGGNSSISGSFSSNDAEDLANILNSGKLDVKVKIIEEAIVGPSLGQESINRGLMSLLAGLILVLFFMVFYYNKSGFVSDFALLINLFFIIGVLASLQAALTLPGIAGIVLTIGMSVDANVLIFERIREELTAGKGMKLAIKDGYLKAYSSIIDANLTTLLVAIILSSFGTGPIHGFAIILIIGILTSLFSAILITRVVFEAQLTKEKAIRFYSSITKNTLKNININFVGLRKKAYIVSGSIIIIGVVSLFTQGLEYGVDFKGGYSYQVRFDENVNTVELATLLEQPFQGQPEVKIFGPKNQVKITTSFLINSNEDNASDSVLHILQNNLQTIGNDFEILSTQKIGPTIADDIKVSALWSVLFSLIGIFLYIFIRFKKWQYGIAAVFTLFHDVLIIFSLFSIFKDIMPFSLEIDQAFIAALLTVIGYSINDTVVVFDRIREKLSMFKHKPFFGTVNTALNETVSRTLITSLTTLIVVFVLFIFGGEIIRGFSFALVIGIIVGTYSSLFVSTPIVVEFTKKEYLESGKMVK
ncbi:MAG: protein translocase subunit SecDF [Bacteroidota bacterium]|nr:protein translocase subunit SecDF [Bacteroidota bacterium]